MGERKIIGKVMQRYWRLSRGMTLGAQAALIDPDGRLLLIRHTYQPGWRFPGGGVEKGETIETALTREVDEEVGVSLTKPPELFGVYSNEASFPNDHIVLFLARTWEQHRVPEPNYEIAEHRRFAPDALPPDTSPPTARRVAEIFGGAGRSPYW